MATKSHLIHSHTFALYEDNLERIKILAQYFKQGLENNEQCIFVSKQKPEYIVKQLNKVGLDVTEPKINGQLKIFHAHEVYLPQDKFDPEDMLNNLENFVAETSTLSYSGVRGAGDMDPLILSGATLSEIKVYESKVNLVRGNFTGLCLLPLKLLNKGLSRAYLRTHQTVYYNGRHWPNTYFSDPALLLNPNTPISKFVEEWLSRVELLKRTHSSQFVIKADRLLTSLAI